jgi:hypothetical protein
MRKARIKIEVAAWLMTLVDGFAAAAGKLEVYVIDVEGGKAVPIISPGGETMPIDAGWPASPSSGSFPRSDRGYGAGRGRETNC